MDLKEWTHLLIAGPLSLPVGISQRCSDNVPPPPPRSGSGARQKFWPRAAERWKRSELQRGRGALVAFTSHWAVRDWTRTALSTTCQIYSGKRRWRRRNPKRRARSVPQRLANGTRGTRCCITHCTAAAAPPARPCAPRTARTWEAPRVPTKGPQHGARSAHPARGKGGGIPRTGLSAAPQCPLPGARRAAQCGYSTTRPGAAAGSRSLPYSFKMQPSL